MIMPKKKAVEQSFSLREVEVHEDGSATYELDAPPEKMRSLIEVMVRNILIKGIESAQGETDRWAAERDALKVADKLVRYLDVWETCDSLDYDPEVKEIKEELKKLLWKADHL
jgi:hypothetical protein